MVGNRARETVEVACVEVDVIRRRGRRAALAIARETTSRGARSPSGWTPSVTDPPRESTRRAPSPRTASLISGRRPTPPAANSTVGWNWTNSRSAIRRTCREGERDAVGGRPGRVGAARVQLSEPAGGEQHRGRVDDAGAARRRTPVTPVTPASSVRIRAAAAPNSTGRPAALSARWISAPVASPPAWMMRRMLCPPSRVRATSPSRPGSNTAPRSRQCGDRVGTRRHDRSHGIVVAQPATGRDGVGDVRVDGVTVRRDHGDTALRVLGGGVGGPALADGEHPQPARRRGPRGGQPGDPAADDDEVGVVLPAPPRSCRAASLAAARVADRDHPLHRQAGPLGDVGRRRAPRPCLRWRHRSSAAGVIIFMYGQDARSLTAWKSMPGAALRSWCSMPTSVATRTCFAPVSRAASIMPPVDRILTLSSGTNAFAREVERRRRATALGVHEQLGVGVRLGLGGEFVTVDAGVYVALTGPDLHVGAPGDALDVRAEELVGQEQHLAVRVDRRRPRRPRWTTCSRCRSGL